MNPWLRRSLEIEGWLFGDEPQFLYELASLQQDGDILEIGSWKGKSSCVLAGACIDHAPATKLLCVDSFRMVGNERQLEIHRNEMGAETISDFISNAIKHGFIDAVIPILALSHNFLPLLNVQLRMAFIDGNHDYESAKMDCALVLPLLNTAGGILALHDAVNAQWSGVEQCVDDLRSNPALRFYASRGSIVAFQKI